MVKDRRTDGGRIMVVRFCDEPGVLGAEGDVTPGLILDSALRCCCRCGGRPEPRLAVVLVLVPFSILDCDMTIFGRPSKNSCSASSEVTIAADIFLCKQTDPGETLPDCDDADEMTPL